MKIIFSSVTCWCFSNMKIHNIRWYWQRNVFLLWFNYVKNLLKCGIAAKEMDSFHNVTCWCFSIWNSQHQMTLAEECLILWIRLGCDAFSACCGSKADEMVVLTTQVLCRFHKWVITMVCELLMIVYRILNRICGANQSVTRSYGQGNALICLCKCWLVGEQTWLICINFAAKMKG